MKNLILLIKEFDILTLLPINYSVHDLLKRGKLLQAYRFYNLRTGKGMYFAKKYVDRYNSRHFLIKK